MVSMVVAVLGLSGCASFQAGPGISLSEGFDDSAGGVPCYIIRTPSATFFLEKEGGGLSGMIDWDGVDWIGFHPKKGTESQGEYRGFPNAVHQQDGSFFHARNAGTELSESEVEIQAENHIRILFRSGNGKWQGRWDFFPDRCDFTMTEISPGYKYWILYEGVPGGELDEDDFWFASGDSVRRSIGEKQENDLPAPEWIAFGDPSSPRMLYLVHHEDDNHLDRYYNMRGEMTVFGFGRDGGKKFLDSPQRFSIGFVESTEYGSVNRRIGVLTHKKWVRRRKQ